MKTRSSRKGEPEDRSWLNKNSKGVLAIFGGLVVILAPYTGYKEYQTYKASSAPAVTVQVSGNEPLHGEVVSRNEIVTIIERALKKQHGEDIKLFKKKEAWE